MAKRFSILALLVVVALLAAFAVTHHPADNSVKSQAVSTTPNTPKQPVTITLDQARSRVKARLDALQKMTPQQWNDEMKANPRRPKTLELAIKHNQDLLAKLNAMTPEQFQAWMSSARQSKPAARKLPTVSPKAPAANTAAPAANTVAPAPATQSR